MNLTISKIIGLADPGLDYSWDEYNITAKPLISKENTLDRRDLLIPMAYTYPYITHHSTFTTCVP